MLEYHEASSVGADFLQKKLNKLNSCRKAMDMRGSLIRPTSGYFGLVKYGQFVWPRLEIGFCCSWTSETSNSHQLFDNIVHSLTVFGNLLPCPGAGREGGERSKGEGKKANLFIHPPTSRSPAPDAAISNHFIVIVVENITFCVLWATHPDCDIGTSQ